MSDSQPLQRGLRRLLIRAGKPLVREAERNARAALGAELAAARGELDQVRAELHQVRVELTALRELVGGHQTWLESVGERIDEVAGALVTIAADQEHDRQGIADTVNALIRRVPEAVALDATEEFALDRFDAGVGGEVLGFRGARSDEQERLYLRYEDFFRGSEDLIRGRQLRYLPFLEGHGPVLDVGCGRGEMLELLRERGIDAEGIDLDAAMVERCRAKGLVATQADAAEHLENVQPASLGAVFAAQLIEHLPYPVLLRFLRAARTALRPGGRLIVETVNPHAPQGLKHFWLDPTHRHPLFPEAVIALCRLTGYAEAFVWYPQGSGDPDRDRIEQLDYAVVADTA